jgi:hypothetical protein
MKKRFTTLLICAMITGGALAQLKPSAVVYEVPEGSDLPVIDGEVDAVWEYAPPNNLDKTVINEEPSLGPLGATYWQALWSDEGIWVLLTVADDAFYPWYAPEPDDPNNTWQYDKTELYFDVNDDLEDGGGPLTDWVGGGNGHYQIEPAFTEGSDNGTLMEATRPGHEGVQYAFNVNDPDYIAEYFVPFNILTDRDGARINLTQEVGFDVYIIDRDSEDGTFDNAVWANTGGADGLSTSWNSMDDCGIITFDGAEEPVPIDGITITGGDNITENNGTLQLVAVLEPVDANEGLKWSVEDGVDGGRAKIDGNGVVTGVLNGTVTVTCMSASEFVVEEVEVTISNQIVSMKDVNVIRNPNFDYVNADGTATGYGGGSSEGGAGAPLPQVIDGEAVCTPIESDENWHYQFDQSNLTALPDIDYIFSFVARADETRTFSVDFEDLASGANYNNYGISNDPRSTGRSWWDFDVTGEDIRYTFDVNFDQINDNTVQRLVFQLGLSGVVCYLDSLVLVSVADNDLIEDYIPVTWIDVSGEDEATTVALGGTLQMSAEVSPAEADYPDVKWSVMPGTGWATIDEAGVLTGDSSGTVTVIASAVDDSGIKGMREVKVSWPEGISQHSVNSLKVYPNPAVNELNVVLTKVNTVVSIYNSVGQKMDEVNVAGLEHRFDISSYAQGIYFVKTNDAIAKFIK